MLNCCPDFPYYNTYQGSNYYIDQYFNRYYTNRCINTLPKCYKIIEVPVLQAGKLYIAVQAGTPEAIIAGIVVGATTFTNPLMANNNIFVSKGNLILPPTDRRDGSQFFTKTIDSTTMTFSDPIEDGEFIQIFTL